MAKSENEVPQRLLRRLATDVTIFSFGRGHRHLAPTTPESDDYPFWDIIQPERREPGYYIETSHWPEDASSSSISARELRDVVSRFPAVYDWAMKDMAAADPSAPRPENGQDGHAG